MGVLKPKQTTQTQTTEASPWQGAEKYMDNVLSNAGKLWDQGSGFNPYQGNVNAAISNQTQQGLSGIMNTAQGQGGLLGQSGVQFANGLLGSGGLSDEQRSALDPLLATARGDSLSTVNPYLQAQIDAMNSDIMNKVQSTASANGRYGSGAMGGILGRELGTANANILSTNWENERNRQLQAANSLQDVYGQGLNRASNLALNGQQITDQLYDPATRMLGVGDFYDARAQRQKDADIQAWKDKDMAKWNRLNAYSGVVNGNQGPASQTTTTPTTRPSALQTALGAGSAGLGLLGKLF